MKNKSINDTIVDGYSMLFWTIHNNKVIKSFATFKVIYGIIRLLMYMDKLLAVFKLKNNYHKQKIKFTINQ